MKKFILKFLILFVSLISLMFFSLIFFQKNSMEQRMQPPMMQNAGEFGIEQSLNYENYPMQAPNSEQEPPFWIPMLFIIGFSSVFVYLILKYIDKNFVTPLLLIEKNVGEIKQGSLEVEFKAESENETIKNTFNTLNEMVQGLKQKEKLEDNFIQNLVHDLRTPVIAQERAMEILSEEMQDNPLVDAMIQNNEAYLQMVNYIIEAFSQKEIKIEKTEFNLPKLVSTVIQALQPAASTKNITVINEVPKDFMLYADYVAANRIIMNLTSNAIENIDNDKEVRIKAEKDQTRTTITIEDNGQGISKEDIETLFTKYVSKKKPGSKKSVSGLGLSIVHTLVLKNNGKIHVESEVGAYTKFIIELPNKEKV